MTPLQLIPIIFIALIAAGCGRKDVAGSTDIGNPSETALMTGTLTDPSGLPLRGARMELYPADYIPPAALAKRAAVDSVYAVLSDSTGNFRFEGVVLGSYNLLGRNALGDSVLLRAVVLNQAQTSAGLCTLNAAGALSVYAIGDASQGTGAVAIYIEGTPFGVKSTDSANAVLSGLPAGDHAVVFHADSNQVSVSYHVNPAETTLVAPVAIAGDSLAALPPAVRDLQTNLNATGDSVDIRWLDTLSTGNAYLVYRQVESDTARVFINNGHSQPVAIHPGYFEYFDLRSAMPAPNHFIYWVRVRDSAGRLGPFVHSGIVNVP